MRLALHNIHKSFGDNHVLRGLSFEAEGGRAFGLLGRNGSGKTTTARIILDVFLPDRGTVTVNGRKIRAEQARIGYLPEEKGLYPKLPIGEQLAYFGRLRGLTKQAAEKATLYWLKKVELDDEKSNRLETLSKGNQQKIQLICALLTDPEILILDEPFSGLDPINANLLKQIVADQVEGGKLVLFSSHQMAEVETFCDDIAILHDGVIAVSGNLSAIKRSYPQNRIELGLLQNRQLMTADQAQVVLQGYTDESVSVKQRNGYAVELAFTDASLCQPFLSRLLQDEIDIDHYSIIVPSLEDIFVETTARGVVHG